MSDVTDLADLCHAKILTTRQVLMSIGKTAYFTMVEMALGFRKEPSYTGVLENE